MSVLLTTSNNLPSPSSYDLWCGIGDAEPELSDGYKVPNLAEILERAYDEIREEWWTLAHRLNLADQSAALCHTASCNTNVSDFGAMLAWAHLYRTWDTGLNTVLVVCNDPWLFRHLASLGGQTLSTPPSYIGVELRLTLRGYASRTRYALRALFARTRLHRDVQSCPKNKSFFITYGHPASNSEGVDAYFGDLMKWSPHITRILHTDCITDRALELSKDQRSFSLHAWGSLWFALLLPFKRWRLSLKMQNEPTGWLLRRANMLEGSKGQSASIAWQIHCQDRWLKVQRPIKIIWPWENHGWEQALVRSAAGTNTKTIGYQHTIVGQRHWVHTPASNKDGLESLPEKIICNGQVWQDALAEYGVPHNLMEIGGSLRFNLTKPLSRDNTGPIYVALPFVHTIANQMVSAIEAIARKGAHKFIVSDHPMNPYPLKPTPGIERAPGSLGETDGVAAVLYAATTVGLEALIGGLPVLRFIPEDNASVDVIPTSFNVEAAWAQNLPQKLMDVIDATIKVAPADSFFHPPDRAYWLALCDE